MLHFLNLNLCKSWTCGKYHCEAVNDSESVYILDLCNDQNGIYQERPSLVPWQPTGFLPPTPIHPGQLKSLQARLAEDLAPELRKLYEAKKKKTGALAPLLYWHPVGVCQGPTRNIPNGSELPIARFIVILCMCLCFVCGSILSHRAFLDSCGLTTTSTPTRGEMQWLQTSMWVRLKLDDVGAFSSRRFSLRAIGSFCSHS